MSTIVKSDNLKKVKKEEENERKTPSIYLDYAAATPTDPSVVGAMMPYFGIRYGNASSLYASGRRSAGVIAGVREKVAAIIGSSPAEIIFTGSGTESDNLAIVGVARANRVFGDHVIVSAIEHKATLEAAYQLQREGFRVDVLPVNRDGRVNLLRLSELLCAETILVSVMYVNNEIGTIQPISEIAEMVKNVRAAKKKDGIVMKERSGDGSVLGARPSSEFPLFHTDASQATGFFSIDVRELGVDLMTLNSSKIYGPKGVGMLYIREGVAVLPIIVGGGQEHNLRAGTESVPLIVGFGEALQRAEVMRIDESRRLIVLRDYFIKKLREKIPKMVLNGHPMFRSPNNVHISIPYIEGESMLLMLDELGIEASTGSACSARDLKPSYVLLAIGQSDELAHGSIRFTLGRDTTKQELDYVLEVFPPIVERLTAISALTLQS